MCFRYIDDVEITEKQNLYKKEHDGKFFRLNVSTANSSIIGTYRCTMKNDLGSCETSGFINVLSKVSSLLVLFALRDTSMSYPLNFEQSIWLYYFIISFCTFYRLRFPKYSAFCLLFTMMVTAIAYDQRDHNFIAESGTNVQRL